MQTFLPYPSFQRSAQSLDNKRLGKQRVETLQIVRTLRGESHGWSNHPAVRMWRNHETALLYYGLTICDEWCRRGFRDTVTGKLLDYLSSDPTTNGLPSWFGNRAFHLAHRAKLVEKLPAHYVPLFGNLKPRNYVWPV